MPQRRDSIRLIDVAEAAGVSIATASRALSGTSGVSATLAEKVREVSARLGYTVNVHARSLAGGSTSSIGLVVHEIGDPYFSEIASGVLGVAAREGLTVQICHAGRDPENELLQLRTLIAQRVGAILIAGSGYVDPAAEAEARKELDDYQAGGGRVAVIGRHHVQADAVLPDNRAGGRSIAEHILGLGHRKIAVATGSRELTTIVDRLAGFEEALASAGLGVGELNVVEAAFTREGGKQAAARILSEFPEATAIVALNDDMAIGVLSVLRAHGIGVPDQISVAGFDDVAVAGDLAPSLTTIRLPMSELGERVLRLVLRPRTARPRRQATGHELVARDSTGRVRTGRMLTGQRGRPSSAPSAAE